MVTVIANAIDQLLPDWPYPELLLPREAQATIAAASAAIAMDLSSHDVIPLCAEGNVWNLEQLSAAVAHSASDALSTQRNRRRITGTEDGSKLSQELSRGVSGVLHAGRLVADKLLGR